MSGFRTETYYDEEGYLVTKRYLNDEPLFKNNAPSRIKSFKHAELKMWIIDLLNIVKDKDSEFYTFCGFSVNIVDIYGVVTEVCPNRFGVLYKVDDGTGEIGCWQDNRNTLNKDNLRDKVDTVMAGIYKQNLEDNSCNDASVLFTSVNDADKSDNLGEVEVAQWLEKQILSYAEVKNDKFSLGETVHIRGKLVDFRGDRCIRIYNIQPVNNVIEEIDRRFELIHLYETLYCTRSNS